jgi:hypothetical protein
VRPRRRPDALREFALIAVLFFLVAVVLPAASAIVAAATNTRNPF